MVRQNVQAMILILTALLLGSSPAFAILEQTRDDLLVLEDRLKQQFEKHPGLRGHILPMLIAPPSHYWKESKDSFAPAVFQTLTQVFDEPQALIACADCDMWRLHASAEDQLRIANGELTLPELAALKKVPTYQEAVSIATIRETADGVMMQIRSLADGKILFYALADSSQTLSDVKPFSHMAAERDRRLRGDSLFYVAMNMGLYPQGRFQLEFMEQWGARNQHISGLGVSLLNPTGALGLTYYYLNPQYRKLHFGLSAYFPLQNVFSSSSDGNDSNTVVALGSAHFHFSKSYTVFASLDSEGVFSLGVGLLNPLFMPFLL